MRNFSTYFGLLVISSAIIGCGTGSSSKTSVDAEPIQTPTPAVTAATPQFSPAAGSYALTQSVTITDITPGAVIYYTRDGSVPTTSSQRYSSPIIVSGTQAIRAIAAGPSLKPSSIIDAIYSILPPTVSVNNFDFGQNLVNTTATKTVATIVNNLPIPVPVSLSLAGDPSFTLASNQSCGTQIAASSSCDITVAYDPLAAGIQAGTVSVQYTGSVDPPIKVNLSGFSAAVSAGTVDHTMNPQVALYTIASPFDATVSVQFGLTTAYGLTTSAKATPASGGSVGVLVAGMLATSVYHMRATVKLVNGTTYTDADHTFTTGALPGKIIPPIYVNNTPGLTPQPGIELIDTITGKTRTAAIATDLAGNVIWTYPFPDQQFTASLYPIKLMPNGNFIMEVTFNSTGPLAATLPDGAINELREIDLAGKIVHSLSMEDLNARLAAAGFTGLTLQLYSHDVNPLPNGHTLVLANTLKAFQDLPGRPGITNVLGDVVVDLDPDMNPVWVWNTFDHLDVNRQPMGFPDWTHANAITYSPDDGNFLISIRHQNWVIKVNYNHGQGDGGILWKLGYQGDFALQGGVDPTDWFYAQHNPAFFSPNTSGSFALGIMDNGNDRLFPDGTTCKTQPSDCYSAIKVLQINEAAKTATLTYNHKLPGEYYSYFAGDILQLPNGNIEYNLAGLGHDSLIFEETPTSSPETVWQMRVQGTNTYRAFRMPSLYPGVTYGATGK